MQAASAKIWTRIESFIFCHAIYVSLFLIVDDKEPHCASSYYETWDNKVNCHMFLSRVSMWIPWFFLQFWLREKVIHCY